MTGLPRLLLEEAAEFAAGGFGGSLLFLRVAVVEQRPSLWYYICKMNLQSPDDQPFRHYTTKHRMVAWISQKLFGNITYTVRHGLIKGMKRKGGLGWLPELFRDLQERRNNPSGLIRIVDT